MTHSRAIGATMNRVEPDLRPEPAGKAAAAKRAAHTSDGQTALAVAFFGHDAHESTIIKRAQAFAHNGAEVTGFMFARERAKNKRRVACPVVSLGLTVDRNYLARIPKLFGALGVAFKNKAALRAADVFYARNIDMLFLAVMSRWLSGARVPVIYEALDVQRVFVGSGIVSRTFRWAERALMARSDLLVVSSPEFVSRYFAPVQRYDGPVFLLENKICPHQLPEVVGLSGRVRPKGPPWVIGWFGTLRCRRSLNALCRIAERMGSDVEIHIRGIPSHEDLSEAEIQAACAAVRNMRYFGSYASPQDLSDIYGQVHFTWGFDFLDAGSNSDWLLPNRVYEGGAFSAVCLARAGTATGRYVEEKQTGRAFAEPIEDSVAQFLESLDAASYSQLQSRVTAKPANQFFDENDTADLIADMRELSRRHRAG